MEKVNALLHEELGAQFACYDEPCLGRKPAAWQLHLLASAQIQTGIEKLGLRRQELAERLGVAAETISRWVNGALIQSRVMDNLLRLFFALAEVREVLRGANQDPQLGADSRGWPIPPRTTIGYHSFGEPWPPLIAALSRWSRS